MHIPQPSARRLQRHPPIDIYSPIVGRIYPTAIYKSNWHIYIYFQIVGSEYRIQIHILICWGPICLGPNLLGPNLPGTLAHLKIWISATGHYSRGIFSRMQSPAGGKTSRITWAKKKIFMMFVLNLIFVHQSSLHPKYKQLCINGPFWAQELGRSRYIFYCDGLNLTFVYKTSLHPKHKRFILWALWAQGCGVYIFHCDLLNQLFLHQTSLHQKQERLCLWALWLEGTFSTVLRGGDLWIWVLEAIPKIVHVRWSFAIFARARW